MACRALSYIPSTVPPSRLRVLTSILALLNARTYPSRNRRSHLSSLSTASTPPMLPSLLPSSLPPITSTCPPPLILRPYLELKLVKIRNFRWRAERESLFWSRCQSLLPSLLITTSSHSTSSSSSSRRFTQPSLLYSSTEALLVLSLQARLQKPKKSI